MSNSLEQRLKTHSNAFNGLLSLIPAKYYYDDASSDQWNQKKQSKEELKENKRRKLDPDAKDFESKQHPNLSAKELMDNRAESAKPVALPKSLPKALPKSSPKSVPPQSEDESDVEIPDMDVDDDDDEDQKDDSINNEDSIRLEFDDEGNEVTSQEPAKEKKPKKGLSEEEKKKKEENLRLLREKLASKISNLREKRKAPGSKATGAPKSREQILEERKRKQELKKQEKLKRKHEELEEEDSSNSELESDDEPEPDSVLFGNIVFNDGSRVTSDLSKLRNTADKKKGKGPANKDIKAHLQKLEKKNEKLSKMSAEDQLKQKEKDKWQRLMNQAEGIKVKDDEKLLKKALKRKEKSKLKSEIEWRERKQVVKDTIAAKVKRRDENLKTRRENKGKKSSQQTRLKKFTGIVKKSGGGKKKRAGFEGSAKSKTK